MNRRGRVRHEISTPGQNFFAGNLDPAPFAAVVFLLVIFLQLGSLIHTPGVLVHLKNPAAIINVEKANGSIRFGGETFGAAETNRLVEALKSSVRWGRRLMCAWTQTHRQGWRHR